MPHKNRQILQLHRGVRPVFLAAVFLLGFGTVGASLHHFSSAATSAITFYASPAAQTLTTGDSVTVQLRIKDAGAVNVTYAKASLTFPVNLLQVSSISTAGSSFTTQDTQTYSNTTGTITVGQTGKAYDAKVTDFLLATVTFKSVTSGAANLAFTGSSIVSATKGSTNLLTGSSGAIYTIQQPVQQPAQEPPSSQTPPSNLTAPRTGAPATIGDTSGGQTSNESSGDGTTSTTTDQAPDTTVTGLTQTTTQETAQTRLTISHIQAIDITTAGGTIEWQTSRISSTLISYSANSHNYSTTLSVSGLEMTHSVALHSLSPGSPVYYKILATAKDGSTATYNGQFTTAKPKNKTVALVAASTGSGLGLVALVVLMSRLLHHRKLSRPAMPATAGTPTVAPPAPDMSQAIAALALEHAEAPMPAQPVLSQQTITNAQQPPTPITPLESGQRGNTSTEPQQRAAIEPMPRKIVTTERPTLRPAPPSSYTQRGNKPMDMFEEGNQRLNTEGYQDDTQKQ